jgi:hypothetical protein
VSLSSAYSRLTRVTLQSGSQAELTQQNLNANLAYAFRLPQSVVKGEHRVRTSAGYTWFSLSNCLRIPGQLRCSTIADSRRTEYHATADTDFSRIVAGGIQFAYSVNEIPSLSRKSSQTTLTAFLQLSLFSGDYR